MLTFHDTSIHGWQLLQHLARDQSRRLFQWRMRITYQVYYGIAVGSSLTFPKKINRKISGAESVLRMKKKKKEKYKIASTWCRWNYVETRNRAKYFYNLIRSINTNLICLNFSMRKETKEQKLDWNTMTLLTTVARNTNHERQDGLMDGVNIDEQFDRRITARYNKIAHQNHSW